MTSFAESIRSWTPQSYRHNLERALVGFGGNMQRNIMDLGENLQKLFSANEWAAWFRDVDMIDDGNTIVFYAKTRFRASYMENNYGYNLRTYFRRPVNFAVKAKQEHFV